MQLKTTGSRPLTKSIRKYPYKMVFLRINNLQVTKRYSDSSSIDGINKPMFFCKKKV